jgi:hypothetical protein
MTFDTLERSRRGGRPIALLVLTRGSIVHRYTDADRELTVDGQGYSPLAMKRSEIADTGERAKGVLTITLPIDAPCIDWFKPYKRTAVFGVEWKTFHYGDTDVKTEWIGRVVSSEYSDKELMLKCEQRSSKARSVGMNLCVMRGCPLVVYSQGRGMCNLDPADFAVPETLTAVDGTTLTATGISGGALDLGGGYVEWTAPDGELESRSILSQSGDSVEIDYPSDQLEVGLDVTFYPGCAGDWAACEARSNTDNYGGCPNLPVKNPYSGNPR